MNENRKCMDPYADIIDLPHPVSKIHPQMSVYDRAAQFAPFAALTGYESAIQETARITSEKVELDEDSKALLDERLGLLLKKEYHNAAVLITFFRADEKKTGGSYSTVAGNVKKIDIYGNRMIMSDGMVIPLEDIVEIEFAATQQTL
ncbi:MAG: hypothetical protein PHG16_12430 [Lachnospiraceae bacterium]|nr:hypothetical protein [Lachnospiraceae bacterium]